MEKKTIGTFIAALRKAKGLTQKELAELLNVSDKAVSRWERDECAPDLSLIPVIADVFGITSDELLRGQRNNVAADSAREAVKSEKQIRNILKRSMTRYLICSLISGTVALIGLICTMILNFGFQKAYVGFFVGFIFFMVAALCQIIFQILGRNAITTDAVPEDIMKMAQKTLVLGAEYLFGLIFVLLAMCLPLIVLTKGAYCGLTAMSWLKCGSIFGLHAAALWLAGCTVLNSRKGYRKKINWKSPRNQLRLKWLKKGIPVLLVILGLHLGSTALLSQNYHLIVQGRKFDNWDDFRRYMELPRDANGTDLTFLAMEGTGDNTHYIYGNQDGTTVMYHKPAVSMELYATADEEAAGAEPLVRYRHLNKQISSVRLNRGGLPVQVFTQMQTLIVRIIIFFLHLLWGLAYILTGRRIFLQYQREVKQDLR